jgi:hypothetical protein
MPGKPRAKRGDGVTLSYKQVQDQLRQEGIVMSKRGATLRINFFGGREDSARYVESLRDALETGLAMAKSSPRR